MNKFKKLMSVLITAVLLLQMVGITGQVSAAVPDIILDVAMNNGTELASNVTKSGTFQPYNANGTEATWATKGCIILNSASPYVAWDFNVSTAGVYDVYVAFGGPTQRAVSAYTGEDLDTIIASGVTANIHPNEGGSISNDVMYMYPAETKIAESVPFRAGENKLKITAPAGSLYNVKLVYKGDIIEIPELPYEMLSGDTATITSIAAKDFEAKSDDVTVSGANVSIPANGTVSYNINVPEEGAYRIWVRTTSSGTINATLSGISEVAGITMGDGISSKAGWKQKYRDKNTFIMGVYTISPNPEGTTITFSPTTAAVITSLDFIKVNDIPVAATGETVVNLADYKWQSMSSAGYDSVYVWNADNMPAHLKSNGGYGAPGSICNIGSYQYVTHELNLAQAGLYKIKAYTSGVTQDGKTYGFYLNAANTVEELETTTPQEINRDGAGDANSNIYEFVVTAKAAGKFYVTTGFKASASLHRTYNGFTIERIGGNLEVDTVKANTAAAALSNNDTVSKGADTFAVKFTRNADQASVTDLTIGLYDGDAVVPTYKNVENGVVYLTVKKVLDAQKTYTIKVNGVYDEYKSAVTGYALNVVTDTDGAAVSSYAAEASATNVKIPSAADENKRDVTVTGKLLSSYGTPIEGRVVSLKLGSETVWTGLSGVDGVVTAKYEIPLAVADNSQTYTFVLAGDGAADKEVALTYVSAAQEVVILGQLANADTATAVRTFIENPTYQTMFDINPTTDMPAYTGFDEDLVYGQLTNLVVSDVNGFKTAYKKAILLETINQAGAADAESAVEAILASSDDCALLGIDKAKFDCVTGANADALVDAICALNVNDPAKTFEEELAALAAAVDAAIADELKIQYSKTDVTSLAAATAQAYVGQGFDVNLDVTPAQANLTEIVYVIEATDAEIIDSAVVTTEYDAATQIVEGKLVITITIPTAAPVALSTDLTVGKVSLSAPSTAGTATVTLSGTLAFDEGIGYPIVTDIAPKTVTLTTTQNTSTGGYQQSSTPVSGTAPRPTTPDKDEEPEDKPGTTIPGTQTPVDPEPVSNFTDLAGNEWAIEAINTLFEKGIISDNAEKKFRPNDNVTREEFVKMIIEALGLVHETYETDLKDVQPGAWYYPYVATAVEKGIVLGDENGYFHVGENISRQDMAVIIIRVLTKLEHPYETKSTKFADDADISDYARDAMYAAKNLAIINGVGDNMCAPKGTATRAMAAKVIYEMMRTVGL